MGINGRTSFIGDVFLQIRKKAAFDFPTISVFFYIPILVICFQSQSFAANYTDTHGDGALTGWTVEGSRVWGESGGYAQPADGDVNQGFLLNNTSTSNNGVYNVIINVTGMTNSRHGGIVFRYTNTGSYYYLVLYEQNASGTDALNAIKVISNSTDWTAGALWSITNLNYSGLNSIYPIKVEMNGSNFTIYLNDVQLGTFSDGSHPSGKVGYGYHAMWNRYLQYDASSWTDQVSDYTWDISTGGGITAGNGTWGTNNYWTATGGAGTSLVAWPGAGNTATFAGSDGVYTINVNGTQNVDGITFSNGGYTLSGGTVNLGSKNSIYIAPGKTAVINSVINGSAGIVIYGAGELKLDGNNIFTGASVIYGGKPKLTHANSLGATSGATTINSGASIQLSGNTTFAAEQLYISGTGLTWPGVVRTPGDGVNDNVVWPGKLTLQSNSSIGATESGDVLTVSGVIEGNFQFTTDGPGTKILSGTNTFSGGLVANDGILKINNTQALGNFGNSITVNDGAAIDVNGINLQGYTQNVTINGYIDANTGALINTGSDQLSALRQIALGSDAYVGNNGNRFDIGRNYSGTTVITGNNHTLTKVGSNRLFILANGTGLTSVVVNGGVLGLEVDGAVGTTPITINSGATLESWGNRSFTNNITMAGGTLNGSGDALSAVTYSGTFTVTGSNIINNITTDTLTISGIISNTGNITKTGANGIVKLTASNTYTGTTTINSGTLVIGTGGSIYSDGTYAGSVVINNGGVLRIDRSDFWGVHSVFPSVTVTVNQGGIMASNGYNHAIGPLNLNGGTLQSNGGQVDWNTWSLHGTVTVGGSAKSNISDGGGSNNAIKIGNSTAGGVSTLNVGDVVAGTDLEVSTQLIDDRDPVDPYPTVASGITKTGAGTMVLSGSNTYTGVTSINGGTISVGTLADGGANSNIGASTNSAGNLVLNGGTIQYTGGSQSCNRLFTLGTSGGSIDASGSGALTLTNTGSATISGTGTRTLALTGTNTGNNIIAAVINNDGSSNATSLTKSGSGKWIFSGANNYTGTTTISGGTLQIGSGGTTGSISNTSNITNNSALIFNRSNAYTYGGAISGSGSVTQSGTGALTLSNTNSYTGVTTVSGGTLLVTGSTGGSSVVTVNSGATLGGTGTVGGIVNVNGTLAPGTSGAGALTIGNNLVFSGTGSYAVNINGTTAGSNYDQIAQSGTVNLGNSTLSLTLGYAPSVGHSYTIINNDGTDAITGTFNGLNQGATFISSYSSTTYYFTISYTGGTGNDVVLSNIAAPVSENYNNWSYSQPIKLNTTNTGANVLSDVLNFPVLVRLNPGNFDYFSQTLNGGADIRFSKTDGTHLPYQIERWVDNAGNNDTAEIWVLSDRVYGNNATQSFIMYWGKGDATDQSSGPNVFQTGNGFVGVWHLDENPIGNPTGTAGAIKDATANGNHATSTGTMTAGDQVNAMINKGHDMDGSNDGDSVPHNASLNITTALTISAWFKVNAFTNQYARILAKSHTSDANPWNSYALNFDAASHIRGELASNGTPGTQYSVSGNTVINTTDFYYGVFTFDGTTLKLYVNGIQETNTSLRTGTITPNTVPITFGKSNYSSNYFDGILDELCLSGVARDANWIKLCYENQKAGQLMVIVDNDYTWDNSTTAGIQTSSGTWGTNNYWTPDGTHLFAWPGSGFNAIFAGSDGAYTITVNGTQNVDSITFMNSGYTVTGGTALNFVTKPGVTVAAGKSATINSVISGTPGLSKYGTGSITLGGSNTYTGATTINEGTINITTLANGGSSSPLGASAASADKLVFLGGTLNYTGTGHSSNRLFTLGTGGGTINSSGSGVLNMTGTGNMSFNGTGTRTLTMGGTNTGNNILATVINNSGGNATAITKAGSGKWILTGNNGATGAVTISGGTLQIGNGSTSGSIAGNVTNGNTLIFNRSNAYTYSGTISSTGAVTQAGAGKLTISGANSYTGLTTVAAGCTLIVANNTALGNTTGGTSLTAGPDSYTALQLANDVIVTGETVTLNSNSAGNLRSQMIVGSGHTATWNGTITLAGNNYIQLISSGNMTVQGNINGSTSNLLIRGSGNGTLDATLNAGSTNLFKTDNGTWTITSTGNTFGNTQVANGTFKLGVSDALPSSSLIYMGQGNGYNCLFDLNGYNQTVSGIDDDGNAAGDKQITNQGGSASTLTIDASSDHTYAYLITNGAYKLNIVKSGNGTQVLTASNTYTGVTTVSGGTISVSTLANGGSNSNIGSSTNSAANLVLNGGILKYTGAGVSSNRLFTLGT